MAARAPSAKKRAPRPKPGPKRTVEVKVEFNAKYTDRYGSGLSDSKWTATLESGQVTVVRNNCNEKFRVPLSDLEQVVSLLKQEVKITTP